jgi:hypothetical protein
MRAGQGWRPGRDRMRAMTEQQINGTPPEQDSPAAAGVPASERLMGVFGIAFAAGIALIGLDLLTGGKVAALIGAGLAGRAGNE